MVATWGDWIEANPALFSTLVVIGVAIIGGIYKVLTRRTDRGDRAADKRAAEAAKLAEAEAKLDATHVDFGRWACVPFGTGAGRPTTTPLTIEVYEASIWIHAVRLRWRWHTDPEGEWRLEGGECEPYKPAAELPIAVPKGETIELMWAGGPLPKQEAIEWGLDIEWGLSRNGATRERRVGQGNTSWQEVPARD